MFNLYNAQNNNYLDDPEVDAETKLERLKKEYEDYKFHQSYFNNPRDNYRQYLLQAKQVDCSVDHYILEEIEKMKAELER